MMVETPTEWGELATLVARLGRLPDKTGSAHTRARNKLQKIAELVKQSNEHLSNVKRMISERGAELRRLSDDFAHENTQLARSVASVFRRARWRAGGLRLEIFYLYWRLTAFYACCIVGSAWLAYTYRVDIMIRFLSLKQWVTELIRIVNAMDPLL